MRFHRDIFILRSKSHWTNSMSKIFSVSYYHLAEYCFFSIWIRNKMTHCIRKIHFFFITEMQSQRLNWKKYKSRIGSLNYLSIYECRKFGRNEFHMKKRNFYFKTNKKDFCINFFARSISVNRFTIDKTRRKMCMQNRFLWKKKRNWNNCSQFTCMPVLCTLKWRENEFLEYFYYIIQQFLSCCVVNMGAECRLHTQ